MTDDQLFGEVDLEIENQRLREENQKLHGKIKRLNAFIVSKDLAIEYIEWKYGKVMIDENIYTPSKKPMRLVGGKPLFKWKGDD